MINALLLLSVIILPAGLKPVECGREVISIKQGNTVVISVVAFNDTLRVIGKKESVKWLYEEWQEECWPRFKQDEHWSMFKLQHEAILLHIEQHGYVDIHNDESNCNKKALFNALHRSI